MPKIEERKFNSIREMLEDWLSDESRTISICGHFTARDMITWHNILKGTPGGNYIIFSNGGGSPFDIWPEKNNDGKLIEHMLKEERWAVYAYRLNGEEVILKNLPKY